ncbi:hypothetical protein E5673_08965 [Sphingomonas sp. PAMC26645]|uniref:hypothetical protein n=1 Tax=Sphingomonas sp. PAMC26645 TaxID=2565555 RepID=UPI00109E165A|nr:hypothetical protein [Sphingomonas sp. PAMC26645]QCB42345.1 hypothetical protein E5673_08965 [Sphingomonas sp. PAMC26645]
MSLAEIISDVAGRNEKAGVVDRAAAVDQALPRVLADDMLVEQIVRQHLSKSIKQHLCRAQEATVKSFGSRQGSLFDLRQAHALDGVDGIIKSTRAMNRIEFHGLIKMRERQIADDQLYLARLRHAAAETSLIWNKHPDWPWGRVEDFYSNLQQAA